MKNNMKKNIKMLEAHSNITKMKILRAALELFSKKDIKDVRVEEITKRAGYAKGTFYIYFPSKDSVLIEYFNVIDFIYEKAFKDIKGLSATEEMMLLSKTLAEFCQNELKVDIMKTVYSSQLLEKEENKLLYSKERYFYKKIREIIKKGRNNKEFTLEISEDDSVNIYENIIHGVAYDWCLYNGNFSLIKRIDLLTESFLKMIKIK